MTTSTAPATTGTAPATTGEAADIRTLREAADIRTLRDAARQAIDEFERLARAAVETERSAIAGQPCKEALHAVVHENELEMLANRNELASTAAWLMRDLLDCLKTLAQGDVPLARVGNSNLWNRVITAESQLAARRQVAASAGR